MKLIIYGTYLDISILSQIKISMKTNVNYLTIVQPRQVEIYRNLFVATFQILSAFSLISRMVLTSTNINSILSWNKEIHMLATTLISKPNTYFGDIFLFSYHFRICTLLTRYQIIDNKRLVYGILPANCYFEISIRAYLYPYHYTKICCI